MPTPSRAAPRTSTPTRPCSGLQPLLSAQPGTKTGRKMQALIYSWMTRPCLSRRRGTSHPRPATQGQTSSHGKAKAPTLYISLMDPKATALHSLRGTSRGHLQGGPRTWVHIPQANKWGWALESVGGELTQPGTQKPWPDETGQTETMGLPRAPVPGFLCRKFCTNWGKTLQLALWKFPIPVLWCTSPRQPSHYPPPALCHLSQVLPKPPPALPPSPLSMGPECDSSDAHT